MVTRATKTKATKTKGRGRPPKAKPTQVVDTTLPAKEDVVEAEKETKEQVILYVDSEGEEKSKNPIHVLEDPIIVHSEEAVDWGDDIEDKGELVEGNNIPTETTEGENKEAPKEEDKKKDDDKGPNENGGKKKNPTMRDIYGYDYLGRVFDW